MLNMIGREGQKTDLCWFPSCAISVTEGFMAATAAADDDSDPLADGPGWMDGRGVVGARDIEVEVEVEAQG